MLEYPIDEAIAMLTTNLDNARISLKEVDEDMNFTLDQCTTVEVGILPYHNIIPCSNYVEIDKVQGFAGCLTKTFFCCRMRTVLFLYN